MSLSRLRTAASLTSTLALITAGIAVTASAASADPDPNIDLTSCPAGTVNPTGTPIWTGGFTDAQAVHGLTTVKGTSPEAFQGTYVDTITDDAYGNPIFLFDLSGSRITGGASGQGPAGIWAGISGSPVYDADENLIGSVSYSFTGYQGSTLAGITPAENILHADPTQPSPSAVRLSKSERSSLRAAGVKQVGSTLHRLTPQRVVAGASAGRATKNAKKSRYLARKSGNRDTNFGSAGLAPLAATPLVAGGNIATTYSYGAIAFASVGSVTAICGNNKIYAYGHPDENVGASTQTILNASTTGIVSDGPQSYKMVNLDTAPSGSLLADNANGISGVLGTLPAVTDVVTHTTANGNTADRTTHVSTPYALSTIVATQVGNDAYNAFKKDGSGDALMTWLVHYTRTIDGEPTPQTFTRTQRYSASEFFPDEVSYDAASDIETLQQNGFETISIQDVQITSTLLPDYRVFKPASAQYRKGGVYREVPSSGIKAKPGATLNLRLKLDPSAGSTVAPKTVDIAVVTSTSSHGNGSVKFTGQSFGGFDDGEFFGFFDDSGDFEDEPPADFDEVLALLADQPRQDDMIRRLHYHGAHGTTDKFKLVRAPGVVDGSFSVPVVFSK